MEFDIPIKIFLSHPSNDDDTKKVKDILTSAPIEKELYIFPDYKRLELGFIDAIQQTIEEVDLFIVILNKEGREKQWVNQEVGVAVAKQKDIVVIAEKEAIDKNKLEGFINEKNKTILAIDIDDPEKKLHEWLENYKEKHELKLMERVLLDDLKKLLRMIDFQKYKFEHDPKYDRHDKEMIGGYFKQIEDNMLSAFKKVKERGFIGYDTTINLKGRIEATFQVLNRIRTTTTKRNDFQKAIEDSNLFKKLDRYLELRELEI